VAPPFLAYNLALVTALVLSAFIVYLAADNREKPGATPLIVMSLGAIIWVTVKLLEFATRGDPTVFLVTRFNVLGSGLAVVGFVLFSIEYAGHEVPVSRRTIALLAAEPLAVFVVTWFDMTLWWQPTGTDPNALTGYG